MPVAYDLSRATRGRRIQQALNEEDSADDEFWNQEFFKEEQADDDYQSETEEEDVVDSDFDLPEEGDDDGDADADVAEKPRKKTLLPPGSRPNKRKAPPPSRSKQKAAPKAAPVVPDAPTAEEEEERDGEEDEKVGVVLESYEAPSLRRSTLSRIAYAERERQRQEQKKPKRSKSMDKDWKPLTQEELLAEAAQTEIINRASLEALVAREEETKKRAMVVKKKYTGPLVKYHSKRDRDSEKTMLHIMNMAHPPDWLRPQRAPAPSTRPKCCITGKYAKYRHPLTGKPYATLEAFRILQAEAQTLDLVSKPKLKPPSLEGGGNFTGNVTGPGAGLSGGTINSIGQRKGSSGGMMQIDDERGGSMGDYVVGPTPAKGKSRSKGREGRSRSGGNEEGMGMGSAMMQSGRPQLKPDTNDVKLLLTDLQMRLFA